MVLFHKSRLPNTLHILQRLLPIFTLGYGDKEIYWIAATIANEPFSFEPYLAGTYGDCGEVKDLSLCTLLICDNTCFWFIKTDTRDPSCPNTHQPILLPSSIHHPKILHFDPIPLPYRDNIEPYFLNCQYLTEGIEFVGKNKQEVVSKPVPVTSQTSLFDMGEIVEGIEQTTFWTTLTQCVRLCEYTLWYLIDWCGCPIIHYPQVTNACISPTTRIFLYHRRKRCEISRPLWRLQTNGMQCSTSAYQWRNHQVSGTVVCSV